MTNEPEIRFLDRFLRQSKELRKKYRRIDEDIQEWVERLKRGEIHGDRLQGVGDYVVYKDRVSSRDMQRGKRGGFRVAYYLQTQTLTIMLRIIAKTEQEDIPTSELIAGIMEAQDEFPETSEADDAPTPDTAEDTLTELPPTD